MRKFLRATPLVFIIIFVWAFLRWLGADFSFSDSFGRILSLAFIIGCFAILPMEFHKSANISAKAFAIDLSLAIVALVAVTALCTTFWATHKTFFLVDVFIAALALADIGVSSYNSFKVALRSFAAGTAGPDQDTE